MPKPTAATRRVSAMTENQLDLQVRYAWDWFSYHARQRLTAFNFFLILMGAVVVGYAQAVSNHSPVVGAALGFLGAFVAHAFWAMDVRNEELVNCGRAALDILEQQLGVSIRRDDRERRQLGEAMRGPVEKRLRLVLGAGWFSHRMWLRAVIISMGLLSLGAGIWGTTGFTGSSRTHQTLTLIKPQRHRHAVVFALPRKAPPHGDKTRPRHSSARRSQWRSPSIGAQASP